MKPHASWIRRVGFNTVEKVDWPTINELNNLTSIRLDEEMDTKAMAPDSFPKLKWLECYWNKDLEAKFCEFSRLESLDVRAFKSKDLSCIKRLSKLKHLDICYSRTLTTIDDLAGFKKLEFLMLENNSRLEDISPIERCSRIKALRIADNKRARGYESIGSLAKLEELTLLGTMPSLSWLTKLKKLRALRFDCVIEDGDIEFLYEMDTLQHVFYRQKRNLNVKLKDIESHLKEKGFDPESRDPDYGPMRYFPGYP